MARRSPFRETAAFALTSASALAVMVACTHDGASARWSLLPHSMGCAPEPDDAGAAGPPAARVQRVTLSNPGGQQLQLEAEFIGRVPQPRVISSPSGPHDVPGSIHTDFLIHPAHARDGRVIAVSSAADAGSGWRSDISEFDKSNPNILVSAVATGSVLTVVLNLAGQNDALGSQSFKADVDTAQMMSGKPDVAGNPDPVPIKSPHCRWDIAVPNRVPRPQQPTEPAAPAPGTAPRALPQPGPAPASVLPFPFSGIDQHGFLQNAAARCSSGDNAAMAVRTDESLVVICRSPAGSLYYKGTRLKDSAGIQLDDVASTSDGYIATNSAARTTYELSLTGLLIKLDGNTVAAEKAVESAFL